MQKITTFLTFQDRAEEAVEFYTSVFEDAEITGTTRYPESPAGTPGSLMTATFELFGQEYVALNGGSSFTFSQGISLLVTCESQEEVDRYWDALTEGGAPGPCGWLTDKFGVSWQIAPRVLFEMISDPDREKAGRAMQAMLQMGKIEIDELQRAYDGVAVG